MAQARPALTVDVGAAQQSVKGSRQNGKAALAHAAASAVAPSSNGAGGSLYNGQKNAIRPGDIISEDDLAAQGGFSSDEEAQDMVGTNAHRPPLASHSIGIMDPSQQMAYNEVDGRDFIHSESSEEEDYGPEGEGEIMSDDDEEQYDDEEELSSSPSIPDENIDFDLVYALHNFIATVEGQATVNKGNSLTLLDDSNSYWWLVRVLRTQEVGYIPAENIETPYERLARLNKHRNVDLTSATDDDHIQVPEKIYTSHLIKQRSFGSKGFSTHSGKLSALSRRNHGPKPKRLSVLEESKHGVQFGPDTYLEHSGNEYSDDEDEEDYDDENDLVDMDDEEGEEDEEEEDDDDMLDDRADDNAAYADRQANSDREGQSGSYDDSLQSQQNARAPGVEHMEPDDGMAWDRRETERIQRASEERSAAREAAEQLTLMSNGVNSQHSAPQRQLQQQQKHVQRQPAQVQDPQVEQQRQRNQVAAGNVSSTLDSQNQIRAQARPLQQQQLQARNPDRLSSSTMSSTGSNSGFLPSQLQAARERPSSDINNTAQKVDIKGQPQQQGQTRSEKRTSLRKSRGEDEIAEEKQGKKRSGVFSGLFSRSKDKKDRKSGHFSQSSVDSDNARLSEDSSRQNLAGGSSQNVSNAGRTLQERDRQQQEAYQKQFLQDGRPARPGSLIATPGSAPMLNVLRVFAGNEVDSSATFKTVLLNQSTTAGDLLRQVLQRFRLGVLDQQQLGEYCLTIKLAEGDERVLEPSERPLQVLDKLTDMVNPADQEFKGTLPSVKRSSVGSISSVSSNLSLNPAIARLESDFSDDHHVKLYLHRRNSDHATFNSQMQTSMDNSYGSSNASRSAAGLTPASANMDRTGSNQSTDELTPNGQSMRFPVRVLIFPSDLPEGIVFDPQTNALVPQKALSVRGPAGQTLGEGIPQDYREKILALPRNITVAEVIEQGLERFGILDGVVEGGDDVEDRNNRRRSKSRVRYGLSVKAGGSERSLQPSSRILDAFTSAPTLRPAPTRRRSKRGSTDSAMLLSMAEEMRSDDPVFILRQVQRHSHRPSRPLSPTENLLASKQDERRQAELSSVAPTPSDRALEEVRGGKDPLELEQQGLSRQEIIAAQRAAARERRAAILATQPNQENGVDVVLDDRSRLRSSRMLDTGKVRYSFIPVSGEEHDISAIVEDVLRSEASANGAYLSAPRPPAHFSRQGSAATIEDFVSARGSQAATPLSLSEVNVTYPTPDPSGGRPDDALQQLLHNGDTDEITVEDRIDQVLARLGGSSSQPNRAIDNGQAQARNLNHAKGGSIGSSHETASPISGNTHPSGTTTPTPLSMLAASGSAGAALAAVTGSGGGAQTRSVNQTAKATKTTPLPSNAMSEAGIAQLYAVAEAAARKKPPRKRSTRAFPHGVTITDAPPDDNFQPSVAGLFPPMAPYIEDRKIKDAYAPIGRHLNGLEDTLDQLLKDALKI